MEIKAELVQVQVVIGFIVRFLSLAVSPFVVAVVPSCFSLIKMTSERLCESKFNRDLSERMLVCITRAPFVHAKGFSFNSKMWLHKIDK